MLPLYWPMDDDQLELTLQILEVSYLDITFCQIPDMS